ncbi:hypothetical protein [Bacteroides gallinarum]|nr:hypothetical protein [Bacteroides gallinarum]
MRKKGKMKKRGKGKVRKSEKGNEGRQREGEGTVRGQGIKRSGC